MTAAQVIDVVARLQTADAVSACTQVTVSRFLDKLSTMQKWPKSWSNIEDPVVPFERNLHGHPVAGLFWERQLEKVLPGLGWRKVPNWQCLFACGWNGWNWLIWENRHRFVTMFTWDVLNVSAKRTKVLLRTKKMFVSRISARVTENLRGLEKCERNAGKGLDPRIHRKQGLFLSEDFSWYDVTWKEATSRSLAKEVDDARCDLEEPHVFLGCTRCECKLDESGVEEYRTDVRIVDLSLPEELKSCLVLKNRTRTRSLGLMTRKDMRRNALNDIVTWQTKRDSNYTKSQVFAWMTIIPRRRNLKRCEHCQRCALKSSWNASTWDAWWTRHSMGSVHKLARAVTKRTRACDKRLARLISYVHSTSYYCQSCGKHSTTMQTWIVSRLWFCGRLEDSKSTSGGILCILRSRTFVPVSWMDKKQTSVSHSSTGSEVVFLDAGLRMDGILALDFWDVHPKHEATCCAMNIVKKTFQT